MHWCIVFSTVKNTDIMINDGLFLALFKGALGTILTKQLFALEIGK